MERFKDNIVSEPLIDHPELIRKDISHLARKDKVVLADLLCHFMNYRVSYALAMPSLINNNSDDYYKTRELIENMAASDDFNTNLNRIRFVSDFYKKYFLPVDGDIKDSIHNETNILLKCCENFLIESEVLKKPSLESMIDKAEKSIANIKADKDVTLSR